MLNVLDEKWKDHLYDLDQLRNAIHYRSWGQKDPLIEYKQEAYKMFVDLMHDIYNTFSRAVPQGPAGVRAAGRAAAAAARGAEEAVQRAWAFSRTFRRKRRTRPAEGTDAVVDIGPSEPPQTAGRDGEEGSDRSSARAGRGR